MFFCAAGIALQETFQGKGVAFYKIAEYADGL